MFPMWKEGGEGMIPSMSDMLNWIGGSGDDKWPIKVRVSLPSDSDRRWFTVGLFGDYIFFTVFETEHWHSEYKLTTMNMLKLDSPMPLDEAVREFLVHEAWPKNVYRAITMWMEEDFV